MPQVFRVTAGDASKLVFAPLLAVPNAAGAGAGDSVSTPVSVVSQFGDGLLPSANYLVLIAPSQPCTAVATAKSSTGFTVTLTPLSSGVSLAAGSFDALVIGLSG